MTHPPATDKLAGLRVVLTRALADTLSLAKAIERDGGEVLHFPVLVVEPLPDPQPAQAVVRRLNQFEIAVFVSKNAARFGARLVQAHGGFPAGICLLAVGPGTAHTLRELGCPKPVYPTDRHDTDGLLALPALREAAVTGRRVAIFRGEGGLETLATRLRSRGATVDYVELYRRVKPVVEANQLAALQRRGTVDLILVTSSDALVNLFAMVGEKQLRWLAGCQFLVPSTRVAAAARQTGVKLDPLVSAGLSDEALMRQIRCWYSEIN